MVFQDHINDHIQHYRAHYDQIIRSTPLEYASLCPTREHIRRNPIVNTGTMGISGHRPETFTHRLLHNGSAYKRAALK
jgi:hypothetical protein